MRYMKKMLSVLTASLMGCAMCAVVPSETQITAEAAVSYPLQYFRLGMFDTNQNVNASGTSLVPAEQNGTTAENGQ